jgi:hypothetical protein
VNRIRSGLLAWPIGHVVPIWRPLLGYTGSYIHLVTIDRIHLACTMGHLGLVWRRILIPGMEHGTCHH